jgi:hypothetical protein
MSDLIVPLMIEGVIIGKVTIDDLNHFSAEITSPNTPSHLKEIMLTKSVEAVSMSIDYLEPPITHSPAIGHLRLVRE